MAAQLIDDRYPPSPREMRGTAVGVHTPSESVSMTGCAVSVPFSRAKNSPAATQSPTIGQVTAPRPYEVLATAVTGSGAAAAIHEVSAPAGLVLNALRTATVMAAASNFRVSEVRAATGETVIWF